MRPGGVRRIIQSFEDMTAKEQKKEIDELKEENWDVKTR